MLDYKDIIIKHYALGMSGREIARTLSVSKTGVNSFLNAFKECKTLSYPLPEVAAQQAFKQTGHDAGSFLKLPTM